MAYLNKVAVWQRSDGGVSITYVDERDRLPGESDDELFNRMVAKHGKSEQLSGLTYSVIAKDKVKPHSKKTRGFINGEIIDDPAKVAAIDSKKQNKQAILSKLKITESELKDLING